MPDPLLQRATQLVTLLKASGVRLVLAESCTGGLVAAQLARVPGVSDWWCGSAVTYRQDTKVRWIDVSAESIRDHTAVSQQVAEQMASGVLRKTPEAGIAAAITGHLGPNAPEEIDGIVFIAIATTEPACDVTRHLLTTNDRESRQKEAAMLVLDQLIKTLA